jgi:GDP-L-fucose synthase
MEKNAKIYVAGHLGLVGSAILNNLRSKGYHNFVLRSIDELDLTDQHAVDAFFKEERPAYVFLAAAHVGGIIANLTYRADFIYINLQIQNNIIHHAWKYGVKKLLFLGSTCIYPRLAPQPMSEDSLLTSPLEYTNEPYAIAKIAGLKLCESYNLQYDTNFIAVMPTNLYGPNDNFNLEKSHVLPALIRKAHLGKCLMEGDEAAVRLDFDHYPVEGVNGKASWDAILEKLKKYGVTPEQITIWGTGKPTREFLWSEEMADACVFVMEKVNFSDLKGNATEIRNCHINIGTGKEVSIRDLASLVAAKIGYKGRLFFDHTKPDGTMRKLTDPSKLHQLGWHHQIEIDKGIEMLYKWYVGN